MREYKNLVATLYLKNGKAVKSIDNLEELEDTKNLIKLYNDSGIDKIMILHKRKSGTLNLNPEFRIPDFFFNFPKANLLH